MEHSEEQNVVVVVETFGDETIAIIRELMQLALITGTNIVDHLRAVEVQKDSETGKLIPTENYVVAYNEMIDDIARKAQAAQDAQQSESDGPELELPEVSSGNESEDSDLN